MKTALSRAQFTRQRAANARRRRPEQGKMVFALFPGVTNALALAARCWDAHNSVRQARGYPMRPKSRSYASYLGLQSPEIICKHWRQTATLPLSKLSSFRACWRTERRRRTKIARGRCFSIVVLHQQPVGSLDRVDVTRPGARTRPQGSGDTVSSAARRSFDASFVTDRCTHTVVTAADRARNKLCNEC